MSLPRLGSIVRYIRDVKHMITLCYIDSISGDWSERFCCSPWSNVVRGSKEKAKPRWQKTMGGFWEQRVASISYPIRTQGPQSHNHKEMISSNHWISLEADVCPVAFRWECRPIDTLIAAWWTPEVRTLSIHVWTSDLKHCKIINEYHLLSY